MKERTAVIDHTRQDPWEVALAQFTIAADKLHLDPNMREILSTCQRELSVHFPVRMGNGVVKVNYTASGSPVRDTRIAE